MTKTLLIKTYDRLLWLAVALAAILAFTSNSVSGWLGSQEGGWFPVISRAALSSVTPTQSAFSAVLYGESQKLRRCDFHSIEWSLVEAGGATPVAVTFQDLARVRIPGDFSFGPWQVAIPVSRLPETFAVVNHRCHPFWITQTVFWVGDAIQPRRLAP